MCAPAASIFQAPVRRSVRARPLNLPAGLIDIHCHILPGVDDGPRATEVSAHMCSLAQAAGTAAIISTPHANHRFTYDAAKTSALCAELEGRLARPLRLFRGCELELSVESLSAALACVEHYTLNGSRYLLVELMPTGMPPNLETVFSRLLDRGVTPILAHPERSLHLHLVRLSRLVQRGCLAQITGASLTGCMGPRSQAAAMELLRRRLVHFVASDGHDPVRRPPRLIDAYRFISRTLAPALADRLCMENPLAVLEDRPIQAWPAF